MRVIVWIVLLLGLRLTAEAQSGSVTAAPWCGDNAVIETFTETKGFFGKPRFALLSVFTQTAADLEISSPLWPGERVELDKAKAQPLAGWTGWEFNTKDLSLKQREKLGAATKFDFALSFKERGKVAAPVLRLTNMVMGEVWLLFVHPDRDSHELPRLSAAARARVRVLSLEGNTWTDLRGQWVSAAAAEQQAIPMFCGLARSFVNELLDERVNNPSQLPVGIILVSPQFKPPSSPKAYELFVPGLVEVKTDLSESSALARAAAAAQRAAIDVRPRFRRAEAKEMSRLTELKREGHAGDVLLASPVSWQKIVAGDQVDLPVRVSGVVW